MIQVQIQKNKSGEELLENGASKNLRISSSIISPLFSKIIQ
jgi:hypothetical protein